MEKKSINLKSKKIGNVKSHFLDSGAFTLWTSALEYYQKNNCGRWDYYDTDEFWEYVDKYAQFIKKYKIAIDLYANVDAIGNPEITYRNQKYLEEEYGLKPVPVVHYGTGLKWLKKYMKEGYELIGFGGLVGNTGNRYCREWLNKCFDAICNTPDRLPRVKIHGFGVMNPNFLYNYPWWSVDATNAEKLARYGKILIPRKTNQIYDYTKKTYVVALSEKVETYPFNINYKSITPLKRKMVEEWLDYINNSKEFNKKLSFNTNEDYKAANFFYYKQLANNIPKWPHPFTIKKRRDLYDSVYIRG